MHQRCSRLAAEIPRWTPSRLAPCAFFSSGMVYRSKCVGDLNMSGEPVAPVSRRACRPGE